MTITKTAIGNYLRKQPNGDVGMYRNGFKDGVAWAQRRLAVPQMRKTTRDEKIVNPGVYEVPDNTERSGADRPTCAPS